MIHLQRTLEIDAKPEAVWAVLGRFMHVDAFAPAVKSVDALTEGEDGVGSKRRCHFDNGGSVVEEVTAWKEGQSFRVQLSEMAGMPIDEMHAEISLEPAGDNGSKVIWSTAYRVKYGPFGWLLGQTLMKMMMGKILDDNLRGLTDKVRTNAA